MRKSGTKVNLVYGCGLGAEHLPTLQMSLGESKGIPYFTKRKQLKHSKESLRVCRGGVGREGIWIELI